MEPARASAEPLDPSEFFRLNEELAAELARLEATGALDRLVELLGAADARLYVAAARPRQGLEELLGVLRPRAPGEAPGAAWDHEGVMAMRGRARVTLPDGDVREVYLPDHLCPACLNDVGNRIDGCSRVCPRCAAAW